MITQNKSDGQLQWRSTHFEAWYIQKLCGNQFVLRSIAFASISLHNRVNFSVIHKIDAQVFLRVFLSEKVIHATDAQNLLCESKRTCTSSWNQESVQAPLLICRGRKILWDQVSNTWSLGQHIKPVHGMFEQERSNPWRPIRNTKHSNSTIVSHSILITISVQFQDPEQSTMLFLERNCHVMFLFFTTHKGLWDQPLITQKVCFPSNEMCAEPEPKVTEVTLLNFQKDISLCVCARSSRSTFSVLLPKICLPQIRNGVFSGAVQTEGPRLSRKHEQ